MAVTGEICEQSGFYLSSGGCGHAKQRTVRKGETLLCCHACGRLVNWTLLREWSDAPEKSDAEM